MPTVNGSYNLPAGYQAVPGQTILSSQHNPPLEDLAQAMTARLPRDGSAPMVSNLPMGGNRVTGLGAGVSSTDAVRKDQVTPYSAYLSSVSTLTVPADRLIYTTATNTAATAIFTAFGRSVAATSSASTARMILELGTLATQDAADYVIDGPTFVAGTSTVEGFTTPAKTRASIEARSVGWGQSWQDVTGSRSAGVTYQNTTARPIQLSIFGQVSTGVTQLQASTNGSTWVWIGEWNRIDDVFRAEIVNTIIPVGHYYRVLISSGTFALSKWSELR